jgi:hypothetical protein
VTTEWLDDAFGPDGIRVTIAVEPAVQRWIRARDQWTAPLFGWLPSRWQPRNLLPVVIQQRILKNAWAVNVESDSGVRVRLVRPTREAAWSAARTVSESVLQHGVSALGGVT